MTREQDRQLQERVLETLGDFDLHRLKTLFEDLDFMPSDDPLDTSNWTTRARGHLKGNPRVV